VLYRIWENAVLDRKKAINEMDAFEKELTDINRKLAGATAQAKFLAALHPDEIYTDQEFGKLHREVTKRTDEIIDRVLQLRKQLYGTEKR
jgi:hypothetical protein